MQALHTCDEAEQALMYDTSPSLKRSATALEQDDMKTPKRTRGRTGCLNCRRRRKKCDEAKPNCSKCQSRGEECEWDTGITFRLSGLDPQHPSMLQARAPNSVVSQNGLRIVDVQFNKKPSSTGSDKAGSNQRVQPLNTSSARANDLDVNSNGDSSEDRTPCRPSTDAPCSDVNGTVGLCTIPEEPSSACTTAEVTCDSSSLPKCRRFPIEQANPADIVEETDCSPAIIETVFDADEEMPDYPRSNSDGSTSMPSLPWSTSMSVSSVTSVSSRSTKNDQTKHDSWNDGLTHLDSLDCLMNDRTHHNLRGVSVTTTNGWAATTSLEKSKQKLLQQTQDLVHKISLAHQTSSDTDADESATALGDLRLNSESKFKGIRLVHTPLVARPLGCTKLQKRRQLELWRNYIDNIAPSLDICGNKPYFQHSLPMLAKSADHLHYAVLAISSRHMENRQADTSHSESSGLHQDAINLLLSELHTLDTPTIATFALLCIMDVLCSPPSQSRESLSTCATLMDTADVNARSGGFRQAIFWCFANIAAWNSLSHPDQPTALPVKSFYPSDSLTTAVNYIRSLTLGDGYAKYAIFLTTAIIDTLSRSSLGLNSKQNNSSNASRLAQAQAQHSALTDLLSDWSNCRPEDMQPLMSYPSILDDHHHPFPMVLYPTVPATIGNLLYHCASILLLQQTPGLSADNGKCTTRCNSGQQTESSAKNTSTKCAPPETPTGKGITWHARQICGILSESHDPAVLLHGRHALDVAGKVMGHTTEKEAVLELLERIERETGWKRRL